MRIVAVICNVVLAAFSGLVLVTDGPPVGAPYVVLTLLVIAVPLASAIVILRGTGGGSRPALAVERLTIVGNLVLLVLSGWALVDQYPHPDEEGLIPYTVLLLAAPILTVAALSGGARRIRGSTTPSRRSAPPRTSRDIQRGRGPGSGLRKESAA
ncbi:MAG: hypothetical protein ACM3O7_08625 [Acidobacteriota bacterium]